MKYYADSPHPSPSTLQATKEILARGEVNPMRMWMWPTSTFSYHDQPEVGACQRGAGSVCSRTSSTAPVTEDIKTRRSVACGFARRRRVLHCKLQGKETKNESTLEAGGCAYSSLDGRQGYCFAGGLFDGYWGMASTSPNSRIFHAFCNDGFGASRRDLIPFTLPMAREAQTKTNRRRFEEIGGGSKESFRTAPQTYCPLTGILQATSSLVGITHE